MYRYNYMAVPLVVSGCCKLAQGWGNVPWSLQVPAPSSGDGKTWMCPVADPDVAGAEVAPVLVRQSARSEHSLYPSIPIPSIPAGIIKYYSWYLPDGLQKLFLELSSSRDNC